MHVDFTLAAAGLFVGFLVGLTGMGGGALMTPILILVFRVHPLAAVSSDLVASFFMKPIGAFVHFRRGTVHLKMVGWLMVGSIPSAFAGVFVLRLLGQGSNVQSITQIALGVALLLATATMIFKALLNLRQRARGEHLAPAVSPTDVPVKPIPTILVGVAGGLIVGMTSVGSGSLVIACLLLLYPRLRANQLVGTDLLQAIPLVGAAALSHLFFGDFKLSLTTSLLIGAIPGVYIGARASAQAPARLVRRALAFVLLASGLKLVQVATVPLAVILVAVAVLGEPAWALVRRTNGFIRRSEAGGALATLANRQTAEVGAGLPSVGDPAASGVR
ncbi:MAG: sulfite exporter TauE/SafE family protein [Candidatus Dormibacteraeota bacterium]|nr:sulfite exporter TauE/SafE family protein [Candidatus Dormibacteraeota bacterium]